MTNDELTTELRRLAAKAEKSAKVYANRQLFSEFNFHAGRQFAYEHAANLLEAETK